MSYRSRTLMLIVIQVALVSSIAAKYLYERATCPRVWVKVAQYDPNLPMRGRYLALTPLVDACELPKNKEAASNWSPYSRPGRTPGKVQYWQWRVITKARGGKLVVENARNVLPHTDTQTIWLASDDPCSSAPVTPGVDFFIPDTAKSPFPSKPGMELWTEVTVPPQGPPRPIQLAISDNGQWKPLKSN